MRVLVFDEASLLSRLMDDRSMAEDIVLAFLGDMPKQLITLQQLLGAGDQAGVTRQAHAMRGAAAAVSGIALMQLAGEMEDAGRARDLVRARLLLPRAEEEFARLKATIEECFSIASGG
jgi:HPt (histidine-containing phosphotransfer) domain-containing protein